MKRLTRAGTILLAVIMAMALPSPVYALNAPDNITINSVQAVRNTVEVGDVAIVFYFNTVYDDYPTDVTASEAVILRLYDTDNTTLLATSSPYSLFDYGYGPQVGSFYFDAADNLTWEQPYIINITYSEAFLESPPVKTRILASSEYATPTSQADNQALLVSWILARCIELEAARPDYLLHGTTDSGIVLTSIGEAYFRGAIPGLQSMAMDLFFLQYTTPEAMDIEYTANMTEVYEERLTGTDLKVGLERVGASLGVTWSFVLTIFFFVTALAMIIFTSYKGWGPEPGMLCGGNWLTLGALLGGGSILVLRMVIAFIAGIMLLYVMLFKKA